MNKCGLNQMLSLILTSTEYLQCILGKDMVLTLYLNGICGILCIKFNLHNPVRLSIFFKNNNLKLLYWKSLVLFSENVITNYSTRIHSCLRILSWVSSPQLIIISFWRQDWYIFRKMEGGRLLKTFRLGISKTDKPNGLV